jgi:1-aminocyclopropane-1-carboxylate synthase
MHLICDEIYALSSFSESSQFTSAVSILNNTMTDYIHILWGFSKDFGASGLRLGALYTQNKLLLNAYANLGWTFTSSNWVQQALTFLLEDETFIDAYIAENKYRLRLSYNFLSNALSNMSINVIPADAALFCLIDLRHLLREMSWEAEDELQKNLVNFGIVFTPGSACHLPTPGYFRVCYAWLSMNSLSKFIDRMKYFVAQYKL